MARTDDRPVRVFLSHSPRDRGLRDELLTHLRVLEKFGRIDVWNDRHIKGGADWHAEVEHGLARANVAIVLLSADFLASDFAASNEFNELCARQERGGVRVVPVLLRSCLWEEHDWLARMQVLSKDGSPIASLTGTSRDRAWASVAAEIARLVAIDAPTAKRAANPFQTVGPLLPTSASYVERRCDATLREQLTAASATIVVGSCRAGKTSLLARSWAAQAEREWGGVFLDCQAMRADDPTLLRRQLLRTISQSLEGVDDWGDLLEALRKNPTVFYLDEFGVIDYEAAKRIVAYVSELIEQVGPHVRFVATALSREDINTALIRAVTDRAACIEVEPFGAEEIRLLTSHLPPPASEALSGMWPDALRLSAGAPHKIQCLCRRLFEATQDDKTPAELVSIVRDPASYV